MEENRFLVSLLNNPTVITEIVEQFDRHGNEDGNRDENGNWVFLKLVKEQVQFIVSEEVDWTYPRYDDDSLWDDIVASIEVVLVVGEGLNVPDVGTDNDDDSLEDNFFSYYEEDDGTDDRSVNDEEDSDCSVVDEDELSKHSSEEEIARNERMYASGIM
ncbi:LOW QUALITY PROTEIN: hypothetical protein Cgig2_001281 [Carnegiea gigantea]|uniref:Uncharacterized protein n=1 Tax=Carnegiea gigantea TaxID=171969 RepID=A0A9Q1QKE9_9CARY|nr:LOW QUALITY PROTEIN: hypothetical protein Cgig2_001281 [Carnegiea gigantea]